MPFDFSAYLVSLGETPASSAKMNNLIQAIQDGMNALPITSLEDFPSDDSKFLNGDGGWTVPMTDQVVRYVKTDPTSYSSSSSLEDMFGGDITIGAGTVGAYGCIRIFAVGALMNNTGVAQQINFQLGLGGTALWETGMSDDIGASSNWRIWSFHAMIQALGSTASQYSGGNLSMSDDNPAAVGYGVFHPVDGNGKFACPFEGIHSTVNMTGAKDLTLKAQMSDNSANFITTCEFARVEVAP